MPGDYEPLIQMLNTACKGEYDIKIDGAPDMAVSSANAPDEKGKGKARGGKQGGSGGRGGGASGRGGAARGGKK